jgi:hypothetical protein
MQLSKAARPVTGGTEARESREAKEHTHDITLSTIMFFAHNMLAFGVPVASIAAVLRKVRV